MPEPISFLGGLEFDFKKPDYAAIYKLRAERIAAIRAKPENLIRIKEFYANNPVNFIMDFGMTSDPRNAEVGLPVTIPFILFPHQIDFVNWVVERWRNKEDGLTEKSRDMGVSWLCVAIAVWFFLFHKGSIIGFGSRKQEYVDKSGDPKSLFWKIRQFIELLPEEFKPEGYNENKHALHMRIINPENGAAIVGEAGENIGRGARTSVYFMDEAAFFDQPDSIDAALSQTSNCKINVSTPNGNGNPFYRKRHGGKMPIFTFHWTNDPRKDEKWYQDQKNKYDAVIVAQEIDIDYNASVADSFINGDDIMTAMKTQPMDIEVVGPWIVGVDAAHFGDDLSIIHSRRGRFNMPQKTFAKIDGQQLAGAVIDHCNDLSRAGTEVAMIVIELDGPGVSCYDHLKYSKYASKVRGIHTGQRLKDNKNYNLKAKLWRDARDYISDGPIVLPNDPALKSELASVKYTYRDGLLLMQSKKEYKGIYGKSPDKADAFVLTHFQGMKPPPLVDESGKKKIIYANGQRSLGWMG